MTVHQFPAHEERLEPRKSYRVRLVGNTRTIALGDEVRIGLVRADVTKLVPEGEDVWLWITVQEGGSE